jgi:hypothetical protein
MAPRAGVRTDPFKRGQLVDACGADRPACDQRPLRVPGERVDVGCADQSEQPVGDEPVPCPGGQVAAEEHPGRDKSSFRAGAVRRSPARKGVPSARPRAASSPPSSSPRRRGTSRAHRGRRRGLRPCRASARRSPPRSRASLRQEAPPVRRDRAGAPAVSGLRRFGGRRASVVDGGADQRWRGVRELAVGSCAESAVDRREREAKGNECRRLEDRLVVEPDAA